MSRHPGRSESAPSPTEFLSRWSRRKAAARESTVAEPPAVPPQKSATQAPLPGGTDEALPAAPAAAANPAGAARADQPIPDDPIPPIDSLTESSDFSRFMRPDIPAEIRKLALRKMFQSPIYNLRDGLDDYDDDFTSFEPLGDIVTADMRYHTEREQAERERAAAEAAQAERAAADEAQGHAESDSVTTAQTDGSNREAAPDKDGGDTLPAQLREPGVEPLAAGHAQADPVGHGEPPAPLPGPRLGKLRRRQDADS